MRNAFGFILCLFFII